MKRIYCLFGLLALTACAGTGNEMYYETPTVDYIESLDVYAAPHQDSFLNQLAMNYRSYAIFNARQSGYADIGEQFAQKAVAAFSGETPFPETIDAWPVSDNNLKMELQTGCRQLLEALKNDAADCQPALAAEAQAKFDCWLSASASMQDSTANECRARFHNAMTTLNSTTGCCKAVIVGGKTVSDCNGAKHNVAYYPETAAMRAMTDTSRAREGIVIVNNINIPQNLINPVPVFNQSINYNGGAPVIEEIDCIDGECVDIIEEPDLVSRSEFIETMVALRSELSAINKRLDEMALAGEEKMILKVQQIPLEPKQSVMEEIFEVRFDFDKSNIKPEYEKIIHKLVETTRANRNVKISVVGHTDTMGSSDYNYALGGRRAEAVRKMLVQYGIPSDQIVSVSSGKADPKIPTGDGVANAENRRVRVVKETMYEEPAMPVQTMVEIKAGEVAEVHPIEVVEVQTTEVRERFMKPRPVK